ncbi:MAG: cobyric acid synthase [Pseudomonadota bacterium]
MTARALMFQGTGSDVGKSVLTAAFCRLAKRRGLSVAPFKPQNMSNNAAACPTGGEIGRAQALQAQAAGLAPHVDMNPVLLKPQTDKTAQVVLHGKPLSAMAAADYIANRGNLLDAVLTSFEKLGKQHDLILVEGAGSPAEVNLRQEDIANMGFARRAGVPVCLIGDIEKGGVIASLVGTKAVLDPADAAMIRGFLVNKFRGDSRLFDSGVTEIETRTSWPCLGVIPWISATAHLPAEDAVVLSRKMAPAQRKLKIAAPMLSRIANFDDADPLRLESDVDFQWIAPGQPIPKDTDIIVLFGTKSTLCDLAFVRAQGWDHDIIAYARSGGHVLGICGGFQMLGKRIVDEFGVDGHTGDEKGLGLLNVETVMAKEKTVRPVKARSAMNSLRIEGYEIHMGRTFGPDCERPFSHIDGQAEGAIAPSGNVAGTYLHGAFTNDQFRRAWLGQLGHNAKDKFSYKAAVDQAIDALADQVEAAVKIDQLFALAKPIGQTPDQ